MFHFRWSILLKEFFRFRIEQIGNQYDGHEAYVPSEIVPGCNGAFFDSCKQGFEELGHSVGKRTFIFNSFFSLWKMGLTLVIPFVIPQGFKPWTFRTGICQPILSKSSVFIGLFGFPQKRICADFAPIRLVNTLVVGCKGNNNLADSATKLENFP